MNLIAKKQTEEKSHTTRYGNTYTAHEWAEVQRIFDEEAQAATDFFQRQGIAVNAGIKMLRKSGLFESATDAQLRSALTAITPPQFTSEEKEAAFNEVSKWVDGQY